MVPVLRDGYRVPFKGSPPPLARTPVSFPTYRAGSPRAHALRQEVEVMLAKGALEIARDPGPGFYSRLFLVEKATGGWRPVIDLSHLNDFVQLTPFKMETVASVLLSVREGDFLASLDLKDAYFQIPIHGSSRKLLRFMSEGTVYQFKALCFGLSTAPQVFTRVFAAVSAWAHARGIRLLRYLDDWLVLSSSEKKAKESIRELLSLCRTLGIVINEKKSDLVPSQSAKYLGMTIDTGAGKVFPSLARVEKFLTVAERFCSMQSPPAQLWQVLLGHLASLERLVPHGRLRMRSLQWHLKTQWSPESDPPSLLVALPEEARRGSVLVDGEGSPVDGGSIRGTCAGSAPVFGCVFVGVGCSPPRSKRVRGVVRPGEVVAHQSSRNEGPLSGSSGFSRSCSRSPCDRDVRQLHGCGVRQQTGGHGFQVPVFVDQPPSEMDGEFRRPSRCEVSTRRVQRPGRCSQPSRASCGEQSGLSTFRWRGHFFVRGAIRQSTCLRPASTRSCPCIACLSRIPRPSSRMRFAILGMTWICMRFPPFALVGRVIARVQQSSRVAMTLVAPLWPEKERFADLLLLLTQPPLALPCWDKLLRQPHCSLFHQGVHALNLHAWQLSSDTTESRAFREELLESCQGSSENPPLDCTSRDGRSSVVGVVEGALLQSTPLFL